MSIETGWLPDYLLIGDSFANGVAVFADATGRITRLSREPDDLARAVRLPGQALLPGCVNAHSHSFQRVIRGRTEHRTTATRDTFWTWREKMYHAATALTTEEIQATARMCFLEMALAGITTVGEFHYLHHAADGTPYVDRSLLSKLIAAAAREVGLRLVLIETAYARAGWNRPANPGQRRFITADPNQFIADVEASRAFVASTYADGAVTVAVAPHSLRAVTLDYFKQVSAFARQHGLPVHMHVSEQTGENDDCVGEYGTTPVTLLAREGELHDAFTAIHAVHITETEAAALRNAGATVCACPTTERNLGDGIVRADWLLAGGHMALGTDSQVQIAPLEDARQLEYHLRLTHRERAVLALNAGVPDDRVSGLAGKLFACATEHGARSLKLGTGKLAPGNAADFFTVDINDPSLAGADEQSLLAGIVFSLERTAIRQVFVGGKQIVRDGAHALTPSVTAQFTAVQRRLWNRS
jgi:formimidoylglutamate deiminase